jgi:glycosyltransferase involved in cell wall biosynthesis
LKILFINKYDITGGAGIAASRLAKGLNQHYRTENYFLVGIKRSIFYNVFETRKPGLQNTIEKGANFLFNLAGLQYKWFPFSSKTIIEKAKEISPDVISLHNLHGGYFKTSLLIELSKIAPLFWTLHDMWAFTANAAHTLGDESWKNLKAGPGERKSFPPIGINIGNWLLKQKKKIYKDSNLTIITPSKWLYNLAIQSPVFEGKQIVQIYNGIDTNIFKPLDKEEVRKKYSIPINSRVLVFGAEKIMSSSYKGGENLINILKKLNNSVKEKIHLIIIGEGNLNLIKEFQNFVLHHAGYVKDEINVAKYLAAADLMIYPTKADNLPNALIEANACGVPAVTYDIGGSKEIISNNENGYVIPPFNENLFVEKINELIFNQKLKKLKEFSNNSRRIAEELFSLKKMSDQYYSLYSA